MSSAHSVKASKTIQVSPEQASVCCPPKDQHSWNMHPRVYLELDKKGYADCPYCGNRFQRQPQTR